MSRLCGSFGKARNYATWAVCCKHRFETQLQNHGYGQQKNGFANATSGKILPFARQRQTDIIKYTMKRSCDVRQRHT